MPRQRRDSKRKGGKRTRHVLNRKRRLEKRARAKKRARAAPALVYRPSSRVNIVKKSAVAAKKPRKGFARKVLVSAAAAVIAVGSLAGCPRSKEAKEAYAKRKFAEWKQTVKGRRCLKLTERTAEVAQISPAEVLDRVRYMDVSNDTLARIFKESRQVSRTQSKIRLSTEQNKRSFRSLEKRKTRLKSDYALMRHLLDANLVRAVFDDLPEAELPASGSELQAAVRGHNSFTVKKQEFFDSSINSRIRPDQRQKKIAFKSKSGASRPASKSKTSEGGVSKIKTIASSSRTAKPAPKPATGFSVPSGKQWPQIFEIYTNWKHELNNPRWANSARAAISLVEEVAASTGTSPAQVIAVKAKYSVFKNTPEKYLKGITRTESRIYDALLEQSAEHEKVFKYFGRAVGRQWFSNSKQRIVALARGN